jgi:transposase
MNPISLDLRTRIVQAVNHDKNTPEQAAKRFIVSIASVYRFLQLDRDLNDLKPAPKPPNARKISDEHAPALHAQVQANNDATLEEHCQTWHETTGIQISVPTMQRALTRLNITRKKATMPVRCAFMVKKCFNPLNVTKLHA